MDTLKYDDCANGFLYGGREKKTGIVSSILIQNTVGKMFYLWVMFIIFLFQTECRNITIKGIDCNPEHTVGIQEILLIDG